MPFKCGVRGREWKREKVAPLDFEEVAEAILKLVNEKAAGPDGLPGEPFKYGGEEL